MATWTRQLLCAFVLAIAACGGRVGAHGEMDGETEGAGGMPCEGALDPSRWTQTLSAGDHRTCQIRDGHAVCWGQSGDSPEPPDDVLVQVSTSGIYNACGLTPQGRVVCWGGDWPMILLPIPEGSFDSVQAVGFPNNPFACAIPQGGGPVECFGGFSDPRPREDPWVHQAAGGGVICGLTTDCAPDCIFSTTNPPNGARFVQLATSASRRCGVHFDGTIECWGYDGFNHVYTEPFGDESFERVSVGDDVICALRTDGTLACVSQSPDSPFPDPPDGVFAEISVGSTHACALAVDGEVVCWGSDDYGESTPP